MEKRKLKYPVIVEGKYDKNTLSQLFDGVILSVGGFSVFNSKEKQSLLRKMARDGIVILTDSDGGGRQIRSFLSGILPADKIHNAFVPKIEGKEKRKKTPSKSGLLGVEGMDKELLYNLFLPYSNSERKRADLGGITKNDFYFDGLSGGDDSKSKRAMLAKELSLPDDMSANALLEALNLLISKEEYRSLLSKISK